MTKNAPHNTTLRPDINSGVARLPTRAQPSPKTRAATHCCAAFCRICISSTRPLHASSVTAQCWENWALSQPQEQPLLLFHDTPGVGMSELTFCAWDSAAPGLLAQLCGTMAALKISIHTAFIYTFRDERNLLGHFAAPDAARSIALDTFLISESHFRHDRALGNKNKKRLQSELSAVLRGESSVRGLLQKARLRSFAPLEIHELRCENRPQDEFTRLSLRAADKPGVLYRTTNALAQMGLHICVAQISTREEAANDIFFLTDASGQRVPDFQLSTLEAQLRARLQENAPDTPFDLA